MKINTIVLFLLFFSTAGLGQNVTVKIGSDYKLEKDEIFADHLYSDHSGHYVLMRNTSREGVTEVITKFTPDFQKVWSNPFIPGDNGNRFYTFGLKYFQSNFLNLIKEVDKDKGLSIYHLLPIGKDGEISEPKTIFKFKQNTEVTNQVWSVSKDSSALGVGLISDTYGEKKKKVNYFIKILDLSLIHI